MSRIELYICIFFCLTVLGVNSRAQDDRLGFYANPDGTGHEIFVMPFELVSTYMIAHVPSLPEGVGILGAGCGVTDWIEGDGVFGVVAITWMGYGHIYNPTDQISVVFHNPAFPDKNDNVILARIDYFSLDPTWPGICIGIESVGIINPHGQDPSPIVVDSELNIYYVAGDVITINPVTPTQESTVSIIKALY